MKWVLLVVAIAIVISISVRLKRLEAWAAKQTEQQGGQGQLGNGEVKLSGTVLGFQQPAGC
jgi:hypothetical protein